MIDLQSDLGPERALLIGVHTARSDYWRMEESLEELGELVRSAGGEVASKAFQRVESPHAACYIGKGKAEELSKVANDCGALAVVFDDELSPVQARNLERIFSRKVIDRTQLILDIFAQRARSREGKIQIELAQLNYLLPRLTRMWTHLSRQKGGIGTRGPGETQLEIDRRRIEERIARLERELAEARRHREVQRRGRARHQWPICTLVGYTNAGKSTLMNRLTRSDVYAADQLFATLDPTIRQFRLPSQHPVLLCDTVGFLRKLPHHLVEAFQATLEEVTHTDLLIHVVDVSHSQYERHIEAVDEVLKRIHAGEKQTLMVFNKIDRLQNRYFVERLLETYPHAVGISALTGEGMEDFFSELDQMLNSWMKKVRIRIPQGEGALLAEVHRHCRVWETRYDGDDVILLVHLPPLLQGRLKGYILPDHDAHSRDAGERAPSGATVG